MSRKQRAPLAKQGAPRRDSPAADDAATSPSSAIALKSAGFLATEDDQKKFASRILARAYSRMDLPTFRAPIFGGGAALAAAGAVLSFARDQTSAMAIAAGAAGVLAVAFVASTVRERARRDKDSVFDPRGCYLDENGLLVPALDDDEQLLLVHDADGRDRTLVRAISGAFQATWGVLLAGLPLATAIPGSAFGAALALGGTLLGAGIFGRGVRTVFFHQAVKRWALTSQRLVGMVAPGSAVSVELRTLRQRPTLVGRADGTATFAAEVRPIASAAPLPIMGIVGFDSLPAKVGEEWATATMEARRKLVDR